MALQRICYVYMKVQLESHQHETCTAGQMFGQAALAKAQLQQKKDAAQVWLLVCVWEGWN